MDTISKERRSENMRRIRSKDMAPELLVRKLAHGMGFRYRLHSASLPGKPDMVFPRLRKLIFVHGCFWHQHQSPKCGISRIPKSNRRYWIPKLRRNRERDMENLKALRALGWETLLVWECETGRSGRVARKLQRFLEHTAAKGKRPNSPKLPSREQSRRP